MENTQNTWSVPVAVDDIPETGLHIEVEAPAEVRAHLVKLANLRDLPHLSAVFDLARRGGGVHVAGQVKARVGQTCVVTLEPLIGGKVNLGAMATEFLLLGIDPYPRKAGAEFAAVKTGNDSARPFAA